MTFPILIYYRRHLQLSGSSRDRSRIITVESGTRSNWTVEEDRTFWVVIGSLILIIAVFVLQILGLQAAAKENKGEVPSVSVLPHLSAFRRCSARWGLPHIFR